MKNKIILNWMPPGMITMPSPSMSVLQKFLQSKGFEVEICYWNIKLYHLQEAFIWNSSSKNDETAMVLLFNNYIAIETKDSEAYAKVKSKLMALKPHYQNVDSDFFDRHMHTYACKLYNLISSELQKHNFDEILYYGMSVNLYQWICASIIASQIKTLYPEMPIVIGGIGTKNAAVAFLRNFSCFDYALWGEGEYNLYALSSYISENAVLSKINQVPNVAYRYNDDIIVGNLSTTQFVDLNSDVAIPDFDDYFNQLSSLKANNLEVSLSIEGSRSCHWKRCHFCYLNNGYKHRMKSVSVVDKQLRNMISKYQCYNYIFLDNDIIGNDRERFSNLLDNLIKIKEDFTNFQIVLAEVITKGIDAELIRKMALAGFVSVQIGYESASDNLLRKIDKKNTFASNLLFIKYATKYDIQINGANVIMGLLEESYEDILESIENLRFQRFFLSVGKFSHSMGSLGIMHSSRYFKLLNGHTEQYRPVELIENLPSKYIKEQDFQDCTIVEKIAVMEKNTWRSFSTVERHYLQSNYSYKLYESSNRLFYIEYMNLSVINKLEIAKDSIDYVVLSAANKAVIGIRELMSLIEKEIKENMTDCELINTIQSLRDEGLVYSNSDFSEIVSVIDIEMTI